MVFLDLDLYNVLFFKSNKVKVKVSSLFYSLFRNEQHRRRFRSSDVNRGFWESGVIITG